MNKQLFNYVIKNDASEFDLHTIFNKLSMIAMNSPQIQIDKPHVKSTQSKSLTIEKQSQKLVNVLSDIKGLKNTLRYIKMTPKIEANQRNGKTEGEEKNIPLSQQVFIRPIPSKTNQGQKQFWMIRDLKESNKTKLNLDCPNFVITFENYLVAIQRKSLTLYEIDGNKIHLKDYDSVSIGKSIICIQLKHVYYQGKNYILIFGNEKEGNKNYLKCLVYEVNNLQFTFIKRANIFQGELFSPSILFQKYPKNQREKFCLILGGCYDNRNSNYYNGWQINLHYLLSSWLTYPTQLTKLVEFDSKRKAILSGKAIKYNDYWYIFCSEDQTVTQIKFDFQHGMLLEGIRLKAVNLNLKEKIYFCENSFYIGLKGSLKMMMLNKNIQFREKEFLDLIHEFESY